MKNKEHLLETWTFIGLICSNAEYEKVETGMFVMLRKWITAFWKGCVCFGGGGGGGLRATDLHMTLQFQLWPQKSQLSAVVQGSTFSRCCCIPHLWHHVRGWSEGGERLAALLPHSKKVQILLLSVWTLHVLPVCAPKLQTRAESLRWLCDCDRDGLLLTWLWLWTPPLAQRQLWLAPAPTCNPHED